MDPIPLGASDREVGPIAYGCWRLAGTAADTPDVDAARAKIITALECGMTLIDTADIYGTDGPGFGSAESLLGRVLAETPSLRGEMVLATKGGIVPGVPYDSSPDYLRSACEASLRRLGTDVIDLYQIHRPDVLTHPSDVAAVLTELWESGKVLSLGVSNFSASQTAVLLDSLGDVPLVSVQPEFSLLHRDPLDDGVLDAAMMRSLTPLAWSPLAGGRLFAPEAPSELTTVLDAFAEREGVTRTAIALAWVMTHPSRPIPIVGTQRPERIREAAAATKVTLSRADWYALAAAAGRDLP